MTSDPETVARECLVWAIAETSIYLPPSIRHEGGWQWDADDVSLRAMCDGGEFRLHVSAERRGARKTRRAVMRVIDDNGSATWDAFWKETFDDA